MVLGIEEDVWMFSNLAFIKNKLWNRLTTHFDLIVKMYAQTFYSLESCFLSKQQFVNGMVIRLVMGWRFNCNVGV